MSEDANAIRILVVDDHLVVREGVDALVRRQTDLRVVAQASNGREAIQQFRAHRPDITLMDLQMPEMNGLDALIALRAEFPEARVIVLTTYTGDVQVLRAIKAGAWAYLLKNALHKELLDTIRAVHAGKKYLSAEASFELAEHASGDALTPAEVRVLRLIAEGNANKEISEQLSVSEDTVKGQVRNILSKLGAKDRTHAAMIGVKRGIIEP
jgi:DNA-binding NarL/FixJ family response regulator